MNLDQKLSLLDGIYRIYADFIRLMPLACDRFCAACCTSRMTLTTLEGYGLLSSLDPDQKEHLLKRILPAGRRHHFQPALTFNRIARLCLQEKNVPDEPMTSDLGACPLLSGLECPVYTLRPFGCRCMVSRVRCDTNGHADMDELILTVNHLLMQYIEHIDLPGLTGSLCDVLVFLSADENRNAYRSGKLPAQAGPLIPNFPIPALMIPPRHRRQVQPILEALRVLLQ